MQVQIASRVLAFILTAFPLAALGYEFDRQERDSLAAFATYEEVRAYIESGLLSSYWACFGGAAPAAVDHSGRRWALAVRHTQDSARRRW